MQSHPLHLRRLFADAFDVVLQGVTHAGELVQVDRIGTFFRRSDVGDALSAVVQTNRAEADGIRRIMGGRCSDADTLRVNGYTACGYAGYVEFIGSSNVIHGLSAVAGRLVNDNVLTCGNFGFRRRRLCRYVGNRLIGVIQLAAVDRIGRIRRYHACRHTLYLTGLVRTVADGNDTGDFVRGGSRTCFACHGFVVQAAVGVGFAFGRISRMDALGLGAVAEVDGVVDRGFDVAAQCVGVVGGYVVVVTDGVRAVAAYYGRVTDGAGVFAADDVAGTDGDGVLGIGFGTFTDGDGVSAFGGGLEADCRGVCAARARVFAVIGRTSGFTSPSLVWKNLIPCSFIRPTASMTLLVTLHALVFDVVGHEAVTVGLGNLGLVRNVGHVRIGAVVHEGNVFDITQACFAVCFD